MNVIHRRTSELRIMFSSFSLLEFAPMRSRIACDDVVPINGRLLPCSERRGAVFPAGLVSALPPPGAPSCCFIGCDCEKSACVSTKEESKRYCCCCCFLCPKECIGLVLDVRIRDGWRRVDCGSFACWPAQGAKPCIPGLVYPPTRSSPVAFIPLRHGDGDDSPILILPPLPVSPLGLASASRRAGSGSLGSACADPKSGGDMIPHFSALFCYELSNDREAPAGTWY